MTPALSTLQSHNPSRCNHYTQWFPGKKNVMADALSRDFGLRDNNLTRLLQLANPPLAAELCCHLYLTKAPLTCLEGATSLLTVAWSSRASTSVDCELSLAHFYSYFLLLPQTLCHQRPGGATNAGDGIGSMPIPSSDIPVGSMISFDSNKSWSCTAKCKSWNFCGDKELGRNTPNRR